jgi:hypothetical protein
LRNYLKMIASGGYSRRDILAMMLGSTAGGVKFLTASDPAEAAEVVDPPAAFPIRIRPGTRILEDSAGTPFLIHGDAAWSMIGQLNRAWVDIYLDDRRARGFNTILVKLLEHKFSANPPKNVFGQGPFVTPGDFSTPNQAYFRYADWVLRRAAEKGFLVLLSPAYLGWQGSDHGWYVEMVANGLTKLRNYGRFIGNRYKDFSNILWVHGGDFDPPNRDVVIAVAEGIRDFDTRSLNTAHCSQDTAALDIWRDQSWLQLNSCYTYGPVYLDALLQYQQPENMPFISIETRYENELDATEQRLRTQSYHALICGAAGQIFGCNPIWNFGGPGIYPAPVTWQQALRGRGSKSMTHLHTLFAGVNWWQLRPDIGNVFLTGGLGADQDRAVAALADDRAFGIVYLPGLRDITVNMSQLAGPMVNARWFDPSSGQFLRIPGSPFPATGQRHFMPSRANAFGFADWVLLLESQ